MPLVLVVDDSRFSRSRVVGGLKEVGYEIIEAGDGNEGFELFQSHKPDLVVTDLLMPVCDGIGQLRKIRDSGSQTPVIIVSADIQSTSKQMCDDLGAFAFLNKPFEKQELLDAAAKALGQSVGV